MYNTNLVIDSRMASRTLYCKDCHMNFKTPEQLDKHTRRFCIGSTSDPDDLQLRRGFRSTSPRRIISPDDRPFSDSALLLNKKLYQLHNLKDQRSRSRDLHDLEERMLLDQLEGNGARSSPVKDRSKLLLSKHQEIRDLQLEYEKLRDNENSVTRHMQGVATGRAGRQTPYSRNSNSSMSIHLDDDYRRNPNQDLQLRNLAQDHGRYMEHLNLRNRDLEKQREDIRKQLENLGRRTVAPPQDNTADLLRELREQEIRNQRALDDLKRQLQDLHNNQRPNIIEIERPVHIQQPPAPAPPPPPPQPEPPKKPLVFPIYYGKSLVAELRAIHQAYLQNDGNSPEVLAQMAQMQAEAQAIEDEMNRKPEHKSPREKPKDTDGTYRLLEIENDRLNQELRLIQEQNLLAQNRRKSDKEDELERDLRRLQREHLEKMYGLQKELDDLRLLLMMQRNQPQAPPPPPPPSQPNTIIHQTAPPPVSLKHYVDVEPMAPYDQYPCNYVPAYHHTWNYNPMYRSSLIPNFPRTKNIIITDPGPDGYQPILGTR